MPAKPGEEIFKRAKNKILDFDQAALVHQAFNSSSIDARIPLERMQQFLLNEKLNSSKTNPRIPPERMQEFLWNKCKNPLERMQEILKN